MALTRTPPCYVPIPCHTHHRLGDSNLHSAHNQGIGPRTASCCPPCNRTLETHTSHRPVAHTHDTYSHSSHHLPSQILVVSTSCWPARRVGLKGITKCYHQMLPQKMLSPTAITKCYYQLLPPTAIINCYHQMLSPNAIVDLWVMIHISLTACTCLLYTSPSPRDQRGSRMPSSA